MAKKIPSLYLFLYGCQNAQDIREEAEVFIKSFHFHEHYIPWSQPASGGHVTEMLAVIAL